MPVTLLNKSDTTPHEVFLGMQDTFKISVRPQITKPNSSNLKHGPKHNESMGIQTYKIEDTPKIVSNYSLSIQQFLNKDKPNQKLNEIGSSLAQPNSNLLTQETITSQLNQELADTLNLLKSSSFVNYASSCQKAYSEYASSIQVQDGNLSTDQSKTFGSTIPTLPELEKAYKAEKLTFPGSLAKPKLVSPNPKLIETVKEAQIKEQELETKLWEAKLKQYSYNNQIKALELLATNLEGYLESGYKVGENDLYFKTDKKTQNIKSNQNVNVKKEIKSVHKELQEDKDWVEDWTNKFKGLKIQHYTNYLDNAKINAVTARSELTEFFGDAFVELEQQLNEQVQKLNSEFDKNLANFGK